MNTPPRFFAAPPPSPRRKLSLALGAALAAVWALGVVVGVVKHFPQAWFLGVLAATAAVWAAHVLRTALYNRALDHGVPTRRPG